MALAPALVSTLDEESQRLGHKNSTLVWYLSRLRRTEVLRCL